ncbi:hypothetical protein D3C75_913170 [compost metagenome]
MIAVHNENITVCSKLDVVDQLAHMLKCKTGGYCAFAVLEGLGNEQVVIARCRGDEGIDYRYVSGIAHSCLEPVPGSGIVFLLPGIGCFHPGTAAAS